MIFEKIEKLSELYLAQNNSIDNKAALQSCFFNLSNLKKIVECDKSFDDKQSILPKLFGKTKMKEAPSHESASHMLIMNSRNSSIIRNSSQFQESFQSKVYPMSFLEGEQTYKNNKITFRQQRRSLLNQRTASILASSSNDFSTIRKEKQKSPSVQKGKQNKFSASMNLFRTKKVPKIMPALAKNQKYFEEAEVNLQQQMVEKLGLYETGNIFKHKNVGKFLDAGYKDKFKPTINLKFATFTLCERNQFFLTDNSCMPELNEGESLEEQKNEQPKKKKKEKADISQSNDTILENNSNLIEQNNDLGNPSSWVITIQNYLLVKNDEYFLLKTNSIEDWSEISFILTQVCQFLKKVKISLLSFKFEKKIFLTQFWSCKKIKYEKFQKLLKIRISTNSSSNKETKISQVHRHYFSSKEEVIRQIFKMWRDRQNLEVLRKNKKREKDLLIWMSLRMIAKQKIKARKKEVEARIKILNEKLLNGEWDYEVEIHIPSFSETESVRNTTQYMEYYENMFYHMWKFSTKHFVLIIPAINETLLQMFQQKIKHNNKNITLICPQSHELYPKSLPVSASLLYSKDGLRRVKTILESKRGIIIPGRHSGSSFMYESYLSDLLNCPLLSTLGAPMKISNMKQLWGNYDIPTTTSVVVDPISTLKHVIELLSQLISDNPKVKTWVFKMNGQFNGRGISTFNVGESKKLKEIVSSQQSDDILSQSSKMRQRLKQQNKTSISEYLQKYFRLKLKVNYQNCIFRVDEYIDKFIEQGGIIQQYVYDCQTYQFCYKLEPGYSHFTHKYILDELDEEKYIACCQNFQVNFTTKSSVFSHNSLPKKLIQFSKAADKILKAEKYLGYVSVTVLYNPKTQKHYGVEIKPYMTANSSMSYFLKNFEKKKKEISNRRNANLMNTMQNISQSPSDLMTNKEANNGLVYLFIPVIVFTDVDETTRSEMIQNLVMQSWEKVSSSLFTQPVVTDNPDSFYGSLYMSLGLSLGVLVYGKHFDLKRMKTKTVNMVRDLSEKVEGMKLYRGKQATRDVFQFGDLIRAINKIK